MSNMGLTLHTTQSVPTHGWPELGCLTAIAMLLLVACTGLPSPAIGTLAPTQADVPQGSVSPTLTSFPPATGPYSDGVLLEAVVDSATGVVEPGSFVDAGVTVTIQRMEWESISDHAMRIEILMSPARESGRYFVDIILGSELKLTLDTKRAMVDSAGTTLTWPNTSVWPWESGEELKIRVREHPLSSLKVVDLEYMRPVNFFERKIVGLHDFDAGDEVYAFDIDSEQWYRYLGDGHRKSDAAMSADYLAWIDQRRHIFVRDLHGWEERRITEVPARRTDLQLFGSILLWVEERSQDGEVGKWYVYAYDLESDKETVFDIEVRWPKIAGVPAVARTMDGYVVAWMDRTMHLYDFSTEEERELRSDRFEFATIRGRKVTWEDWDGIVELDIDTGRRRTILEREKYNTERQDEYRRGPRQGLLVWSENYVAWTMTASCDVIPHPAGTGVFLYDLRTDRVRQLSVDVGIQLWFHEDVLVVYESCLGPLGTYAVFLE